MKVLNCFSVLELSECRGQTDPRTVVILRGLEHFVCGFDYLVPNGWRFIIEMSTAGNTGSPYYVLDVQSNKEGGSWAQAKMRTLNNFDMDATYPVDIGPLLTMMCSIGWGSTDLYREIEKSGGANTAQLSDKLIRSLVDCVEGPGIAPGYGGIRIPYEDMIVEGSTVTEETGEIRIAFSGASAEQDVFLALSVFRALSDEFSAPYPNAQRWLNLRNLRDIPVIRFWLDQLGIKEA